MPNKSISTPAIPIQMRLLFTAEALVPPKSLVQIHLIHCQLIVSGGLFPSLLPKLIHLYSLAGATSSALRLLSDHPHPPPSAFPSLLSALPPLRSLHLYSLARSLHPPDPFLLPPALRSAPQSLIPSLHVEALKFGCVSSPHVRSALISSYARIRDAISARKAFDDGDIFPRDALAHNSLLSAYVVVGDVTAAMDLLTSMQSRGCDPDVVSYNIIINGLCRAARCDEALEIFNRIQHPNVVSWTTIIVGYARCGNHEAALQLFSRMMNEPYVPPDHDTLSCIISLCRHVGLFRSGRSVHGYAIKTSKPGPEEFYCSAGAALVAMYASYGKIVAAERVFRLMDHQDVVTWNALIVGLTRAGEGDLALEYFKHMLAHGIASDETTLATVLTISDSKTVREIHGHLTRKFYNDDTLVCNALMCMYSRLGSIAAARLVFLMIDDKDEVSWNTMIGAYGSHGLAFDAIKMLDEMKRSAVKPNEITFTNVLMACSHAGLVDEGMELFESLVRDYDLVANLEQCACVADMLSRAGKFGKAVKFISKMECSPNASIWGAMLAACEARQDVEFGSLAFNQLIRLEPENAGNYVTMSSIYRKAGRWEEAKAVRRMIDGRRLVKPTGQSWIDVNEERCRF